MKFNLKDVTFIIPIRIDSMVRVENLILCVNYLVRHFECIILVLEASEYNNGILQGLLDKRVDYLFIEDKDPVFHRTRYLNLMTLKSTTPYIGIWDADVIVPKSQIIESIHKLREGVDIAFPYDGSFLDTSDCIRERYLRKLDTKILIQNSTKMSKIYGENMGGGAILVNREAYIKSGLENEKYYGWGHEDCDRLERWMILKYNIYRSTGSLFHLTHSRTTNSTYRSDEHFRKLMKLLAKTKISTPEEVMLMAQI